MSSEYNLLFNYIFFLNKVEMNRVWKIIISMEQKRFFPVTLDTERRSLLSWLHIMNLRAAGRGTLVTSWQGADRRGRPQGSWRGRGARRRWSSRRRSRGWSRPRSCPRLRAPGRPPAPTPWSPGPWWSGRGSDTRTGRYQTWHEAEHWGSRDSGHSPCSPEQNHGRRTQVGHQRQPEQDGEGQQVLSLRPPHLRHLALVRVSLQSLECVPGHEEVRVRGEHHLLPRHHQMSDDHRLRSEVINGFYISTAGREAHDSACIRLYWWINQPQFGYHITLRLISINHHQNSHSQTDEGGINTEYSGPVHLYKFQVWEMSGCQDIVLWGTKGCQDGLLNWLLLCLCHLCFSKTSNKLLFISLFSLSTPLF